MIVGVAGWELEIMGARSLKEKRSVVRSLKDRLRTRFNLSVAETAYQDLWQRAEITVSTVAADQRRVDEVLDRADRLVAGEFRARVIDSYRTFY
ncbi:MAG TPA: DUF503 domain-containing protein [Longimicrobiales bacterium]|nr:DUF503 domain-containing protein [Longimicrobiales bacterium]